MAEWFKALVLKTNVYLIGHRGFKSHFTRFFLCLTASLHLCIFGSLHPLTFLAYFLRNHSILLRNLFHSLSLFIFFFVAYITQLVRVTVCGSGCHGFNSHYSPLFSFSFAVPESCIRCIRCCSGECNPENSIPLLHYLLCCCCCKHPELQAFSL